MIWLKFFQKLVLKKIQFVKHVNLEKKSKLLSNIKIMFPLQLIHMDLFGSSNMLA